MLALLGTGGSLPGYVIGGSASCHPAVPGAVRAVGRRGVAPGLGPLGPGPGVWRQPPPVAQRSLAAPLPRGGRARRTPGSRRENGARPGRGFAGPAPGPRLLGAWLQLCRQSEPAPLPSSRLEGSGRRAGSASAPPDGRGEEREGAEAEDEQRPRWPRGGR